MLYRNIKEGDIFNRLTVIKELKKRYTDGTIKYLCQCSCGNLTEVSSSLLRSGKVASCGCLRKEKLKKDILSKRFGKLLVIEETEKRDVTGGIIYKCLCDCGMIKEVPRRYLVNGNTKSCGCLCSIGEFEIQNILLQNNIIFEKEYSFNDLKEIEKLRFDFAIFKNNILIQLIEFQGEQHFKESNKGFGNFKKISDSDRKKEEYCLKNNIKLIKVHFSKRGKITLKDLELEEYEYKEVKENAVS